MEILTACILLFSTCKNVFTYLKAAGVNLRFQNHLENVSDESTQSLENHNVILLYLLHTIKTNSDASMMCSECSGLEPGNLSS